MAGFSPATTRGCGTTRGRSNPCWRRERWRSTSAGGTGAPASAASGERSVKSAATPPRHVDEVLAVVGRVDAALARMVRADEPASSASAAVRALLRLLPLDAATRVGSIGVGHSARVTDELRELGVEPIVLD